MALTVAEMQAVLQLRDELSPAMRQAAAMVLTSTNQINTNISSVGRSAASTGAAFVAMGGLIQNAVINAAIKVKDLVIGMVDLAAKHEQLIGVSQYMTSSMGMTARQTDELANALNKQGITLIESRNSIIKFAQAGLDLTKAQKLGTVAQSAARIAQENSSETLKRLIWGIQTMQPEILRTAGIVVQADKAYSEWAKTMGRSVQSMSGAERQQALMNAVLKEGEKIAGVYAKTNEYVAGKEQSLKRVREDAYLKVGEALVPILKEWVLLQTEVYKAIANHPQLYLTLAAAATALAIAWGASISPLWKYVEAGAAAFVALVKLILQLAASTTATVANTAATATNTAAQVAHGGALTLMIAQQEAAVVATTASTAATTRQTAAQWALSMATKAFAGVNAIGTAAMGMFTSGAGVTAAGLGALAGSVLAVGAAFVAGWKIGEWISGLHLFGVDALTVGQRVEWLGVWFLAGGKAADEFARGAKAAAEAAEREAEAAKKAAERQKQLREELEKNPRIELQQAIGDISKELLEAQQRGSLTIAQLQQAKVILDKIRTDATKAGVTTLNFNVAGVKDLEANIKELRDKAVAALVADFQKLATAGEIRPDQWITLAERATVIREESKLTKEEFQAMYPLMAGIAKKGEELAASLAKAAEKPLSDLQRTQREGFVKEAGRIRDPEKRAAFLKQLGEMGADAFERFKTEAEDARQKTDELALSGAKWVGEVKKGDQAMKEAAKAGREMALELRGGMKPEEVVKVSAAISALGGISKMTDAEILKIGESLGKAAAAGHPLAKGLKDIADRYWEVAAARKVAEAREWIPEEEVKALEAQFAHIDLSTLEPEVVVKLTENIVKAAEGGQEFSGILAGVAYQGLQARDSLALMTLSTDGLTKGQALAYQSMENQLKQLAVFTKAGPNAMAGWDFSKIKPEKLQEMVANIKAVQAAGMPISDLDQALLDFARGLELSDENAKKLAEHLQAVVQAAAALGPTTKTISDQLKLQRDAMEQAAAEAHGFEGPGAAMAAKGAGTQIGLEDLNVGQLEAYAQKLRDIQNEAERAGVSVPEAFKKAGVPADELTRATEVLRERLGEVPPSIAKSAAELARAEAEQAKAAVSAEKWAAALSGLVQLAAMFGDGLGEVAQTVANITNAFKQIGTMKSGATAYAEAMVKYKDLPAKERMELAQTEKNAAQRAKLMAKIGAAAAAAGQIGRMLDKGIGNQMVAAKAMQGAAAGAQMGAVAGPWGAAAGAVIGGLIGFLKGSKLKKDAKEAGKALGMEVSQELAQKIQQTAKELKVSIKVAALLNLSEAMAESKKAANTFAPQVAALMKGIADGSIPAKEGLEQVGMAFTKIADEAIKAGRVGDAAMVALIKQARDQKLDVPEIKAFVNEQLDMATEGFHKYIAAVYKVSMSQDAMAKSAEKAGREMAESTKAWTDLLSERLSKGLISQEQFDKAITGIKEMGKTAGTVFGAMFTALSGEKGVVGAVDALAGDFEALKESLTASLGEEAAGAILAPFAAAFATINDENLRPLFEGIDGLAQAMKGLANAGYLSTDQFAAMQQGITQMFDQAIAGGADMHTSLLAVAPAIQAAISAAEQFGVPLDADTQRLKTLAEQNGITFKTDPMKAMLDVLVEIAKVMGADIPESVQRMQASITEGAGAVTGAVSGETGAINEEMLKEEARAAALAAREEAGGGIRGMAAGFHAYVETLRAAGKESAAIMAENAQAAVAAAQLAGTGMTASAANSIQQMAQAAANGVPMASALLVEALNSGKVAVGDLASDPAWATLIAQLSSDVPGAAQAAAAAIAAIAASVPTVNIPVSVNGEPVPGSTPPIPEPVVPEEFAGGTRGWRNFGKATAVILHGTEAVVKPGEPALPGQTPNVLPTTVVNLSINENPLQTAQTVEQMRRFTMKTAERELARNLSDRISSGRA